MVILKGLRMEKDYSLFEGFVAASLHDIGKLSLKNNQWEHHECLMEISNRNSFNVDLLDLLGQEIVDLISIHHQKNNKQESNLFDFSDLSYVEYALILSDKIQSSMFREESSIQDVNRKDFDRLKSSERYFNPYYGNVTKWNDTNSASLLNEFFIKLSESGTFKANEQRWANNIFSLQKQILTRYPFKTFVPHLSLKLHLQLSSALFLFLHDEVQKYSDLKQMKKFKFYTFEVRPNFLETFYRLRDVVGLHDITKKFSDNLIKKLFGKYQRELYGVPHKKSNPFLFYNKDSFVFLHTSFQIVNETLQETLNELNIFCNYSAYPKSVG